MQQHDDESPVDHLVELGYVDPEEAAARAEASRQKERLNLQQAAELIKNGRIEEAASLLGKILADDPALATPRRLLAEIHYRAGRLDDAQVQLNWLTYHGIEHPRLALMAGAIALGRRKLQAALEALEYARYVEPELPTVHALAGSAMLRLLRFDEAADAFQEAMKQNPADAGAFDGLAAVCLHRRQFAQAADWALRAVEQNMQLFRGHYHLGLALAHLNRPADALQALEMSAKVDLTRAAAYRRLAQIAEDQLNEPARAATYRELGREIIRRRRESRRRK